MNNNALLQVVVGSELVLRGWPLFLIASGLTADLYWLMEDDGTTEMRGERNPVDHVCHLSASAENQNDLSELET